MNKKAEKIMGTAFFGPALVLLTLFLFIPMILTLVFSFTDFFTLDPQATKFVGLENYTRLFKHNKICNNSSSITNGGSIIISNGNK